MLHIHHGNRLETLANGLLASYDGNAHPFTPRIVITESASLSRWLKHQFCLKDGIACLIDTPLPAKCLWDIAHHTLGTPGKDDPLSRERMHWLVYAALDASSILLKTDFAEVKNYLSQDDIGLKRWQLAGRIADVFDRYQYYRPELIERWTDGEDNHWQAQLWRNISAKIDTHRVALIKRFINTLQKTPESCTLPDRLDLFSLHNLPRLILEAYAGIARHIPVHLWLLAPTEEYWADLASPRQMAEKRREEPDKAMLWQAGNPLLTQWGRQGQAFQDMLLEMDALETEDGQFHQPSRETLLSSLQADIHFAIDDSSTEKMPINEPSPPSIEVNVCHSPMRECQVLHDRLLHCLNADDTLEPEDILVMVPEISQYAPYIEAIFSHPRDSGTPHLPFNISDVTLADEHPLMRAFLELLGLPDSRFTRASVLDLTNIPEVCRHFGLAETDRAELAELFDRLHVYWGLDGQDKEMRFHLPDIDDNTWKQAFRRIMAGFALGSSKIYERGNISPAEGLTAASTQQAACFFDLLDTLRNLTISLRTATTAEQWAIRLDNMVRSIFGDGSGDEDRLSLIHETISQLKELGASLNVELPLAVIRNWLNAELATHTDRGRFYSGGITFCGMKPLRGVPFRIICMMGMHDQAFPRRQKGVEFDLMADIWRHGDPDPVQEDRYLFLETLLAARQRLIISYTGRHIRTNEPLQPSVLVQELLDYSDERYSIGSDKPSESLVHVHPLQAFGRGNFDNEQVSFDAAWLNVTRTLIEHRPPGLSPAWPAFHIEPAEDLLHEVSLQVLAKFFKHPVRHFVQRHLHLFEARDIEIVEDEPFELNGLEAWAIRDRLLDQWLQGKKDEAVRQIQTQGLLPHGSPGAMLLQQLEDDFDETVAPLDFKLPLKRVPVDINLALSVAENDWQLYGRIQHYYEGHGLIHLSASKYHIANMLPLWIDHLCLCADKKTQAVEKSLFACPNAINIIQPVDSDKAREYLAGLLELYQQGQASPLPFMPKSASAWIDAWCSSQDKDKSMKKAMSAWLSGYYPGEEEDFYYQLILRGHDWQPDDVFADYAERILSPLHEHLEQFEGLEATA